MPLDGPLQVPCAILHICSLTYQELFYRGRAAEYELAVAGGLKNALLYHSKLDFEDLFQVFLSQRAEDHDLVDAVHEFRRKLAAGGIHRGAIDLVVEPGVRVGRLLGKSHSAVDEITHLGCAQVGGHDDDTLRKIDPAIVTQCQRGLIENTEQELPQGVGGLFDLVEQQNRQLEFLRMPLGQRLLCQQRMGFTMTQVARRRADQLGDLVRMLELSAV